ncbi:MAG TPA: copper homeostasis protein CutC [Bacillus sp. (in: firmicutes)]|nr:copper homeostasis protein CutC [Bacillus sp. (in: firmicutes)]
MKYIREVCVGSYEEAKKAALLGADRIELCDNLLQGGTTPSFGTIDFASRLAKIDIYVIIRPRGGNFVYSDTEFEIMKKDIEVCKTLGVKGVVLGILTEDNQIDAKRTKYLVDLAHPLNVTFHMAFDEIKDKKGAIDILHQIGVSRILTKGGQGSALKNLSTIRELINYAGNRIVIMPGGGVTIDNIEMVAKETGAIELHGTKLVGKL